MSDQVEQAEKRLRESHLRALTAHPGWRLIEEHLDEVEGRAVDRMVRGGIPLEDYAAAAAEARAVRAIRKYPFEQVASLAAQRTPEEDPHG